MEFSQLRPFLAQPPDSPDYLMEITALILRSNCGPVKSLAEHYENKLNLLWVLKQEEYLCSVEISSPDEDNFTLTVKIKC